MLIVWLKKLSASSFICGVVIGLTSLIPILTPNQSGKAHDHTVMILAGVLIGIGVGAYVATYVIGALRPHDDVW